ncbi:metal ABC transporter substrate-binding protein [Roseibacillus ishigakijimensis]|uniref:Zinc ABC transporter substrate-binding protein n=1 Tax=Roseibacillus ishigakijimensis TaxID=454146 RepID=A0A934RQR5_9BACT|nr:metal ABC transporter substrate-binding protein [Roseibacillus ishigakijimensis]MBK1835225.1 zinc ABC transporter substrate-binding protein [Roseibacillus ishigakijimensis]
MKTLITTLLALLMGWAQGQLKVASLHPLMGDLVTQVGGERVSVLAIGKPGFNSHTFAPTARDLQAMGQVHLVVASGKGLERYLPAVQDAIGSIPILEVGRSIPSRSISGGESLYVCCPEHSHGTVDPHWWHDVSNMERAVKVVEKQLAKMDPEGKIYYKARSQEIRKRYEQLDRWVKGQIAAIPKDQRKLVTAHAAFGYFCEAYKMEPVFVLGLSGDHEVPAQELAKEVAKLQKEGIKAVFPETNSNPKVLAQIARQAGAKVGKKLIADGAAANYDQMMQANVAAIVQALR